MLMNLTPHEITVITDGGNIVVPPSGTVVRVNSSKELVGVVDGINVFKTTFGDVDGLPAPKDGVTYIVSTLVLSALKGTRPDCVAPGDAVRNEKGQVIGVTNFQVL